MSYLGEKSSFLSALINIYNLKIVDLSKLYKDKAIYQNKLNSQGEIFEFFIKDSLSSGFSIKNWDKKQYFWDNFFLFVGGKNKSPDLITRDGVAIEIKKTQEIITIQFNSSYPKQKYLLDKENIELEALYVIGNVSKENFLQMIWFIYGNCIFAKNNLYFSIFENVKKSFNLSDNFLVSTKEIGRIKDIDPLSITDLRIRSMFQVKHPFRIFDYLEFSIEKDKVNCFFLVLEEDWEEFSHNLKREF